MIVKDLTILFVVPADFIFIFLTADVKRKKLATPVSESPCPASTPHQQCADRHRTYIVFSAGCDKDVVANLRVARRTLPELLLSRRSKLSILKSMYLPAAS